MRRLSLRPSDPRMALPRAFYFFYYGALACLSPFLVLYYSQLGLSGREIGLLTGLSPLINLVSAPLWSGLADATRQHKRLLAAAIGGTMLAVLGLSQAHGLLLLIPAVALYAFCLAPIIALVDHTVLEMLGDRRAQYGRQRLWGAIGWGLSAPLMGWLSQRSGLGVTFPGYVLVMLVTLAIATRLPIRPTPLGRPFWQGIRVLLVNRRWVLFMAVIFVSMMARSTGSFLFLHLQDLGATRTLLGVATAIAGLSEIPAFYYSERLLKRWGAHGLLVIGLGCSMLMLLGFSLLTVPWPILFVQILHGTSFSMVWTASVSSAHEMAPEGMGATAQGLLAAVSSGLAAALGNLVGGFLFDQIGAVALFRVAALAVVVGLFALVAFGRSSAQRRALGVGRP